MKKQFNFSPLVLIAVALMSTLMLALFFGIASAGIPPPTCLPDGRPAFEIVRGPENLEITILAIEQNGTENKIKGKLDAQGNGTIPFGEPGVLVQASPGGFRGLPGSGWGVQERQVRIPAGDDTEHLGRFKAKLGTHTECDHGLVDPLVLKTQRQKEVRR